MYSPATDLNRKPGLAVADLPDLPIFCSAILKDDDPRSVTWVDFWDVPTADNEAAGTVAGESYADIAISYARRINMPVFLYYVAFAIEIKIFYGIIERGPIEAAFLARIARDSRQALQ
jgi:hypothetical protein